LRYPIDHHAVIAKNSDKPKNNIIIFIKNIIIKTDIIRKMNPKKKRNKILDDIRENRSSSKKVNSIQNKIVEVINNITENVRGRAIICKSVTEKLLNSMCGV